MKKLILFGLVVIATTVLSQVPTSGLIGRWEFTGNFQDGSGSLNHGSSLSPPTFTADRCGNANQACYFNGTTNFIQMPFLGPTGSASRSIAFWMRTTNSQVNSPRAVFDYGNSTGTGVGDAFQIVYNYCGAGIGLDVSDQAMILGGSCLSDGAWHHVAAVYSSTNTVYTSTKFYIDGVLQSISCNVSGLSQTISTGAVYPITIGRGASSTVRYFEGYLDDFYLYNRALTAAEVLQLFNDGSCGIQGVCYCNGLNVFTTPPVTGATSYAWSLPSGWVGSSTTNVLNATSGSGSGVVTVAITTGCGGVLTRTLNHTYCNISGNALNLTASNVTFCTNSATAITIGPSSTFTGAITYFWQPGGLTTSTVSVSPNVTTTYTVTGFANDLCPTTVNIQVVVTEDCCSTPVDPDIAILPTSVSGTYSGSYYINNNVTLTGSTNFQNAEFIIKPNVQITVSPGTNLNLESAHLYACGLKMWQGIVVQDMGSVSSTIPANGPASLIEDAIIAVDVSNISINYSTPPIDMYNVTFNKNHIGININTADPTIGSLPIRLLGCVFSSRDLPFTSTSWPSAYTNDLRFASFSPLTSLSPPYLLQSYTQVNTKSPYNNQNALIGIKINDVANIPASPTSSGIDIGVTYQGNIDDFNLFDGLGVGIDVTDASLTTMNNVFQNMKYNQQISGMLGNGINHQVTLPRNMNARLDLRPVGAGYQSTSYGNRFWNCYNGVHTENVFEVNIEYGVYRSDQSSTLLGFMPGDKGIFLESNRFDYNIKLSEFNNLNRGIVIFTKLGQYDMGGGMQSPNGIYAGNLSIQQNYFGPQVTSSSALSNEYMNSAIRLIGPNIPFYFMAGTGAIISNKINRVFRGISVNSMFDYPLNIAGNTIYLNDDVVFGAPQQGIEVFDNQGNLSIRDNNISSTGTQNRLTTLVYCRDNSGGGSPLVNCNVLSNSYQAFEFEGNNQNASWKGNSMTNHEYGLVLTNNGVIGTQGSISSPSGNSWNGTWSGPGYETYCNNSNANLSILWVAPSAPFYPNFNGGGFTPYAAGSSIFTIKKGFYRCPGNTYPTLPSQRESSVVGLSSVQEKEAWNINIYPNPSSGQINIVCSEQNEHLVYIVRDVAGKEVSSKKINVNGLETTINIEVQKGVYFMEIKNANGKSIHKKLIVE